MCKTLDLFADSLLFENEQRNDSSAFKSSLTVLKQLPHNHIGQEG